MKSITLKRNIFILLLLLRCVFIQAQQPYGLSLGNVSDLPNKIIFDVFQDTKGFVWIATAEGLFKYDGFSFTAYKSEKQTSVSGSNLKEDRYGRIWYQNFDGYLYYVKNDKLHYLQQNLPPDFISYGITDRYLFVVQKKGVDVFDLKSLQLLNTLPISMDRVEHATVLKENFYLISDDIIYRIDKQFNLSSNNFFRGKNLHIKYIYPYKDKLYVVSKRNEKKELCFFDQKLNFLKSIRIPELTQIQGSDIIDNHIWLHTPNGAFVIDDEGELKKEKAIFPENSSSRVIKDYQGNYWFSSINNGIYIVPDFKDKMYNLNPFYPRTFVNTSNGYLLGTEYGELISSNRQFGNKKLLYSNQEKLPVYYVYCDKENGNIIFSDNGFSILQKKNAKRTHFNIALKEAVRLDQKYYAIVVSGFFGLLLNPEINENVPSVWDNLFYANRDASEPLIAPIKKGLRAKSVAFSPEKQQLFFATNIGTYIVTPDVEQELKKDKEVFFVDKIVCFKGSVFMLDTKGNLYKLASNNKLESLNERWEIPNGAVRRIKCSGQELLVLSTTSVYAYGHNKLRKFNLPVKNNSIKDFWIEGNSIAVLTDEHVLSFSVESKKALKDVFFYIDSLFVNNKPKDWHREQKLNYDENNISVRFSVLEFVDKNIALYYRINGKKWILINKETRNLEFPSLSIGKYVLEFKVHNTVSNQKIQFEILLPFWKKWWFYLLSSFSVAGLIFLYFRKQSNLMKKQIALLDEKIALEKSLGKSVLVSIKSQMNPHFFYNALNTIQAYIFTNDKQRASNYLSKFSKLTRMILEMSEKETVSLTEEIMAIELYLDLEKMRFSDNFSYSITVENGIDKDFTELPPMLLQPYIENSVKHGLLHQQGDKNILISFAQKNDLLYVTIDDNGIGRKRASELNAIKNNRHKSFSTEANEKRLEILNKDRLNKIAVEITDKFDANGKACGTLVLLLIPIK